MNPTFKISCLDCGHRAAYTPSEFTCPNCGSEWREGGGARERNVGWRLDYFFTSPDLKEKIVAADIHAQVMGSDHCPVSLTLDLSG